MRFVFQICVVMIVGLLLAGCKVKAIPAPADPVTAPPRAVGDTWTIKEDTILTTVTVLAVHDSGEFSCRVTDSTGDSDILRYNASLGLLESVDEASKVANTVRRPPAVRLDFPLFVGKQWSDAYTNIGSDGGKYSYRNSYEVKGYEMVSTAAGEFEAFRIRRMNHNVSAGRQWYETYWYAPRVGWTVKGRADWGERWELAAYALQ